VCQLKLLIVLSDCRFGVHARCVLVEGLACDEGAGIQRLLSRVYLWLLKTASALQFKAGLCTVRVHNQGVTCLHVHELLPGAPRGWFTACLWC
jgi:hypothetical protein